MLYMPRTLILHEILLSAPQNLGNQRRDLGFISEFLDWSEQRLEVEDDGSGDGETS